MPPRRRAALRAPLPLQLHLYVSGRGRTEAAVMAAASNTKTNLHAFGIRFKAFKGMRGCRAAAGVAIATWFAIKIPAGSSTRAA